MSACVPCTLVNAEPRAREWTSECARGKLDPLTRERAFERGQGARGNVMVHVSPLELVRDSGRVTRPSVCPRTILYLNLDRIRDRY